MSDQTKSAGGGSVTSVPGLGGLESRRSFLKKAGLGAAAVAAAWAIPKVSTVYASGGTHPGTPPYTPLTGPCIEAPIDFEGLAAGTKVTDQIPCVTVSAKFLSFAPAHAMVFDTSSPTGGDSDLGTPNRGYGGPGIGSGGSAPYGNGGGVGDSGFATNTAGLGKVLIVSEDGDSSDPDDNASGGYLYFHFCTPTNISTLKFLDIETGEYVKIWTWTGAGCTDYQGSIGPVYGNGNNSVLDVNVDRLDVCKLKVKFSGSGAIAEIGRFCR